MSLCRPGKLKSTRRTYLKERLYDEAMVREVLRVELGVELPSPQAHLADRYTVADTKIVVEAARAGKPLGDLVLEHDISFQKIDAIFADYTRINGSMLIPPDVMQLIAKLPLSCTLPFPDAEELYLVMKELSRRGRCGCGADASLCGACARRAGGKPG